MCVVCVTVALSAEAYSNICRKRVCVSLCATGHGSAIPRYSSQLEMRGYACMVHLLMHVTLEWYVTCILWAHDCRAYIGIIPYSVRKYRAGKVSSKSIWTHSAIISHTAFSKSPDMGLMYVDAPHARTHTCTSAPTQSHSTVHLHLHVHAMLNSLFRCFGRYLTPAI